MKEKGLLESLREWIDQKIDSLSKTEVVKGNDKEEMISVEVIYEPNVEDSHGNWMTAETIEKACEDFNTNLEEGKVSANLYHMTNTDKFEIKKTWIHKGFDCIVDGSGEKVTEGTWIAEIQYKDENLWELKKKNVIKGVSVFGHGYIDEETGEITGLTFEGIEDDNSSDE